MNRITRVRACPLFASFASAFGAAQNVPAELLAPSSQFQFIPRLGQYSTLVLIETEDGHVGLGECYGLPHPMASAVLVANLAAPLLVGVDLSQVGSVLQRLRDYCVAQGNSRGPAMEMLSGLDIALFDLRAKLAGLPLHALLGRETAAPVKTYASPVPLCETPEMSVEAALGFVKSGFDALKLKIGREPRRDIEHLEAVRAAVGPDVMLMVDANCAYDLKQAAMLAPKLADFNVAWFEEPLRSDDPDDYLALRRCSSVPIAAGEGEFTAERLTEFLRRGALDIVQPNVTRAGGVSGLLAIAQLCHKYGARFSPHGVGSAIGVAAALHVCVAAPEAFDSYEANCLVNALRNQLTVESLAIEDGWYQVPPGPGLGVSLRAGVLERYGMALPRLG